MAKKALQAEKAKPVTENKPDPKATSWMDGKWVPYLLCTITFIAYYLYSQKSKGFYQHDEIAHYFGMKGVWTEPASIMSNWAKPGFKLIYALPALLGWKFMILFNILVSVCGCLLAYKTAAVFDKRAAFAAFALAATQPFWIEMSFRNYADPVSGVLLLWAIYLFLKDKPLPSGLVLGYAVLVRQEFLILAVPFGLYLLWKKKWLAAVAVGVFPFLYALAALAVKGDFFWMLTEAKLTSEQYNKEYQRMGFDHYFLMSSAIFGAAIVCYTGLFIYQYGYNIFKKVKFEILQEQKIHFVAIPAMVYFLIHCAFNAQFSEIGTATGGNLRYMTAVSPAFAVLGAIGLFHTRKAVGSFVALGILAIFVYSFLSFQHNNVRFILDRNEEEVRDGKVFLFFLLAAVVWIIKVSAEIKSILVSALGLVIAAASLKPYKLSPEDQAVEKIMDWTINNTKIGTVPVFVNHTLANFFYDLRKGEGIPMRGSLDTAAVMKAPPGSLVIWEQHYGYRPNLKMGLHPDLLTQSPDTFRLIHHEISKDQRFNAVVFEKVK